MGKQNDKSGKGKYLRRPNPRDPNKQKILKPSRLDEIFWAYLEYVEMERYRHPYVRSNKSAISS